MYRMIFAVMLLSLALTGCESATTDNNTNATNPAKANTNSQAPAPAATPQPSPSVKAELKAGDKVKVAGNESTMDATVVSVDEKAGKVTVRIQGEGKDTTVSLDNVSKQ